MKQRYYIRVIADEHGKGFGHVYVGGKAPDEGLMPVYDEVTGKTVEVFDEALRPITGDQYSRVLTGARKGENVTETAFDVLQEVGCLDKFDAELRDFQRHMRESLDELFDIMEHGEYDHKFDLKIEFNGKSIEMPLHADLYHRLERFIKEEREDNAQ